jgi:hypothetical protein
MQVIAITVFTITVFTIAVITNAAIAAKKWFQPSGSGP